MPERRGGKRPRKKSRSSTSRWMEVLTAVRIVISLATWWHGDQHGDWPWHRI
jgi:hypothetical protein